jgi:hypothetical protein
MDFHDNSRVVSCTRQTEEVNVISSSWCCKPTKVALPSTYTNHNWIRLINPCVAPKQTMLDLGFSQRWLRSSIFYIVESCIFLQTTQGYNLNIVACKGLAWLIIMGSGLDVWVYWHFLATTVIYNSSHIEILLNNVCLTNLSEESPTNLGLTWISWIHEWTPFYNCHAVRI